MINLFNKTDDSIKMINLCSKTDDFFCSMLTIRREQPTRKKSILNVITGVFCETAIEAAQTDRDLAVQKHMAKKSEYIKTAKDPFQILSAHPSAC